VSVCWWKVFAYVCAEDEQEQRMRSLGSRRRLLLADDDYHRPAQEVGTGKMAGEAMLGKLSAAKLGWLLNASALALSHACISRFGLTLTSIATCSFRVRRACCFKERAPPRCICRPLIIS
jgi:hypothetical protein